MLNTLNAGHLGIRGYALPQLITLAAETGFRGLAFDIAEATSLADQHGAGHVRALFEFAGVTPADWVAPVDWQHDDNREAQLEQLRPMLEVAAELGATTTLTWIMPGNNERDRDEQYAWYMERLRPFARVLGEAGINLALEFIGPKTLRDTFAHEFIWTMGDVLALAKDTGTGNVGLLFDTFHFYTSHADMDDIDALEAGDVLLVHTNDAPAGLGIDEQMDGTRTLPMETGVIPAPEMLRRLAAIGFDGPVETEPFSDRIRQLAADDPVSAAMEAFEAQKRLLETAGLSV
jgi:sugar phosphate isomerase/epimerase